MVRESAVIMHSVRDFELFDVEFENVKFLRATTLSAEQVQLKVVIHCGDGRFEIREQTTAVVTGTVRIIKNTLPVLQLPEPEHSDAIMLDSKDFYKELRLRGYHYAGLFRSVVEARADGTVAKIKWVENNWAAFMDCLLQMAILSIDSRALFLPTSIRKIRINSQDHLKALAQLNQDNPVFECRMSRDLLTIVGGGIEITGLDVSSVSRRKPTGIELWESYVFVPFTSATHCYTKEDAVRICTQFVLENTPQPKIKMIEIDDGDEESGHLATMFDDAFIKMPMVYAEVKIRSNRTIPDLGEKFVGDITANCNIVVARNCLNSADTVEALTKSMSENCFLVSRESTSISGPLTAPKGFALTYVIRTEDETLVVMQRIQERGERPTMIEVSSSDTNFQVISI